MNNIIFTEKSSVGAYGMLAISLIALLTFSFGIVAITIKVGFHLPIIFFLLIWLIPLAGFIASVKIVYFPIIIYDDGLLLNKNDFTWHFFSFGKLFVPWVDIKFSRIKYSGGGQLKTGRSRGINMNYTLWIELLDGRKLYRRLRALNYRPDVEQFIQSLKPLLKQNRVQYQFFSNNQR